MASRSGGAASAHGTDSSPSDDAAPRLVERPEGLTLVGAGMELRGDFSLLRARIAPRRLHTELLVRAARVKGTEHPRAIDPTAGLGEDSFLLAAAGFSVALYERDAVIAALLRDALSRAARDPQLAPIVARMHLVEGDGIVGLRAVGACDTCGAGDMLGAGDTRIPSPHVVYLDPMFAERRKDSAVKKKLQLLQLLEKPCDNEQELLLAARGAHPRKIVVKRPLKGDPLGKQKPSYSVAGRAVRFDVYVCT